MPRRTLPLVGQAVTVMDLDRRTHAVITAVLDGGRRLLVQSADGEQLEFVLRRATATFTAGPASSWPQLRFPAR